MNQGRFLWFKHKMGLLLLKGDEVKRNPQNHEASRKNKKFKCRKKNNSFQNRGNILLRATLLYQKVNPIQSLDKSRELKSI